MSAREQGLFKKFYVNRVDGRNGPGEKHEDCEYFVLDLTHDRHAIPAIAAYAEFCATEYPRLAEDLQAKIATKLAIASEFANIS